MNKISLNSSSDEESESDAAFVYATNVKIHKLPYFDVFIQGKNSANSEEIHQSATTPHFKQTIHQFLLDYRTTPHTGTGVLPATILFGRSLRAKLPHISETPQKDAPVQQCDTAQKQKMKEYADKKAYVKPSKLKEGGAVLLKNPCPFNSTPYQPTPLIITRKKGQ